MRTLAIDPGPTKSAWVLFAEGVPTLWAWEPNEFVRLLLRTNGAGTGEFHNVAIEYMRPRGMATSGDEMDTMFESGRLIEAWGGPFTKVSRHEVKMALCGRGNAKDTNIRQAIIDHYGGDEKAIGGKKCQVCKGSGRRGRGKTRSACPDCLGTVVTFWEGDRELQEVKPGYETPPGPLYKFRRSGMGSHGWAALAVALTYLGRKEVTG